MTLACLMSFAAPRFCVKPRGQLVKKHQFRLR